MLQAKGRVHHVDMDSRTADNILRREIRAKWRDLRTGFMHAGGANKEVPASQLRGVLYRENLIMSDQQFTELVVCASHQHQQQH